MPPESFSRRERVARAGAYRFDVEGWRVELDLPAADVADFRRRLAQLTRGAATCETVGKTAE